MKFLLILATAMLIAGCGGNAVNNDHSGHNLNAAAPANSSTPAVDHNAMGHGNSTDHANMPSSKGAAEAPFELQFLDSMIAHHKGAVEMAMLAETRGQDLKVKELAANIINDQEREIGKMANWRNSWFDGKPEAINMQFPGMSHGMGKMDMKKLESLKGKDFDREFLNQMIPHHEGAIEMAKALKNGKPRAEMNELAEDIIAEQEAEIKQMKEWVAAF